MKKLIVAIFLSLIAGVSMAGPPNHNWHGPARNHGHWKHHNGSWVWVVPAVIGGVIVYQATRTPPVQVQPIYIEKEEVNCSPWTEVQNPDGTITRTRTCVK